MASLPIAPWRPGFPRSYSVGVHSDARYAELDRHALAAPASVTRDIKSLVEYLIIPANTTEERVRLLHRWVCGNISYDMEGLMRGCYGDLSPDGMLRRRTGVCSGYSRIFSALCRAADVECVEVSGFGKGAGWRESLGGDASRAGVSNHAWNAVKLDQGWALLDCTWAAGGEVQGTGTFQYHYDDLYFLTRPDLFIIDHLPSRDSKWALLPRAQVPSPQQFVGHVAERVSFGWLPLTYPQSVIAWDPSEPLCLLFDFFAAKHEGTTKVESVRISNARTRAAVSESWSTVTKEGKGACVDVQLPFGSRGARYCIDIDFRHELSGGYVWPSQAKYTVEC